VKKIKFFYPISHKHLAILRDKKIPNFRIKPASLCKGEWALSFPRTRESRKPGYRVKPGMTGEKEQKRGGASRPMEGGKLFSTTFHVGSVPITI